MNPVRLAFLAVALFFIGTILGLVFRGEIYGWVIKVAGPLQLMTVNPAGFIEAMLKLALGTGVLWCSPVVGMLLAGPRRNWMLGVWFSVLAGWVSLAFAWMTMRDIRSMAEGSPLGIQTGVLFDAIPVWRILLSGPVVVWVIAIVIRVMRGGSLKNEQEPGEESATPESL